ncbi:PDGLE domain-containing protein [Winogradskya consettensis]|uniref:Membrane protein n=1 Tax=Winogradskya consettensis TaxID=113560 RepID=A0A919SGB4_9ACTN|nr:PDGLE domain-containing protein [Actinoplanes consettensis]GIM71072.1 membrane protein [Actinoplanes consettensis]
MSKRLGWFLAGGLLVALLLAGVVSNFASGSPDGLDATARQGCTFDADDEITGGTCMLQQEQGHQMDGSPLAGYGIRGIDNEWLSTGLSGVLGVLLTFGIGGGVFWLARKRKSPEEANT